MPRSLQFTPRDSVDGECLSELNHHQTIGLTFIAQSGLISASAVLIFLTIVARNYIRNLLKPPPGKWRLIRTHVDAYMLSLLLADLLQSVGAMFSVKWALEQRTYCSLFCTAQGALQHIGETGVALSTMAITFHTFFTVFFHVRFPNWVWMVVVSAIWIFLGCFAGVSYVLSSTPFYTPTPFWCWVSDRHGDARIFEEYMWMWLAALTNIILYIPLYFCVRGNIRVNPMTKKITFNFDDFNLFRCCRRRARLGWDMMRGTGGSSINGSTISPPKALHSKEALKLIWYPISYTALVLPISIARWSSFPIDNNTPTNELPMLKTSITVFIFGLSGLVNVLVFMLTRPHLLLFGPRRGQLTETPKPLVPSNNIRPAPTPSGAESFMEWNTKSPGSPWTATTAHTKGALFRVPSSPYVNPKISGDSISVTSMTKRMSDATVGKQDSDIVLQDFTTSDHGATLPRIEVQRPPSVNRMSKTSLRSDPLPVKAMPEQDLEAFRPHSHSDDEHGSHFPYDFRENDSHVTSPAISDGLGSSWVTMPVITRAARSNRTSVETLTIAENGDLVGAKVAMPAPTQPQQTRFHSSRYVV